MAPMETRDPEFARLAHALAELRRRFPDTITTAIHWGYIRHPLHPQQLRLLQGAAGDDDQGPSLLRRGTGAVLRGIWRAGLCLVSRWVARETMRALAGRRFQCVIKTWKFATDGDDPIRDFYFGDLQQRLRLRDVDTLLLCGNVRARSWKAFTRSHASAGALARLPELALVPWWAPLRVAWRQIGASRALRRAADRALDPWDRRLLTAAARAALSGQTAINALCETLGRGVVKRYRPRAVVTLLEGHAWERCLWRGVKTADPSCWAIGYQHTVLHLYSRAVLDPDPDPVVGPLPDIVLCLGERSARLLRDRPGEPPVVLRFGSFRRPPEVAPLPAALDRRAVLVTPEGRAEEVRRLFTFAVDCAHLLPDYRFILRAHPDLPMREALRLVDVTTLGNITMSEGLSIEDDFRRAAWVLYRGSSAALYAILVGLRPVYVDIDTLVIDPLADLAIWRQACRTPAELTEILRTHDATPAERLEGEWREALAYVDDYVSSVGTDAVDQLVQFISERR